MYNSVWYKNLIQPPLSPPDWLFAPIWLFLYITVFIALTLFILKKTNANKSKGYLFFCIQIILNLLWSPAFFGLHKIELGLLIVVLMDIFIILTIKEFIKISKTSGLILIPYLTWVIFATYLNLGYWILN